MNMPGAMLLTSNLPVTAPMVGLIWSAQAVYYHCSARSAPAASTRRG